MLPEQYEKDQQGLDLLDCLLENSMEAFFCINSQWRILAVNHQAESLCHKARTELLGRTLRDALPTVATTLFPLRAQEAIQHHKSLEYTAFSTALDAWFAIRLYPIRPGLAVFVQEITERRGAEEEKQVSDSLAQAILDSLDVMMALLDPDGTICVVNEAWRRRAQASCTPDQLKRTGIGMNYLEVCRQARGACSEEAPEALAGIQAVLQGIQPSFTLEYPCFSATQHNWYLMSVTPLPQNRGAVTAHIDITERMLLDQQKDTYIGMASHELRTPLTALKM
jgi:PAS domain S-box-containing protein